jgi:predicted DCC family thiol-disulfide oxidoreductase YuxK
LARCVQLVPRKLRDLGYRLVARTRRGIFGAWKMGRPLPRAWAERVLD